MKVDKFKKLVNEVFTSKLLKPFKLEILYFNYMDKNGAVDVDYVATALDGQVLPKRDFRLTVDIDTGCTINHGTYSPSNTLADNIQHIVVGELTKELFTIR
jgi:hypothetical protein